jgi:hypothetical protein
MVVPRSEAGTGGVIATGTKFVVTINTPAILWGGRILQLEGDPLSNDFFTKTAVELIGRAGENDEWSFAHKGFS